jgi:hypothetical protein
MSLDHNLSDARWIYHLISELSSLTESQYRNIGNPEIESQYSKSGIRIAISILEKPSLVTFR